MDRSRSLPTPLVVASLCLLVQSLCFLLPVSQAESSAPKRVVLIVIDTLRADYLPFHGYPKDTAPFLSKLTEKGMLFEKAYATSSWTAPSTASIHTSLYPFQHGVELGSNASRKLIKEDPSFRMSRVPEEIDTLAELYKGAGYATFGIVDNGNITKERGFAQGFDHFKTFKNETAEVINRELYSWQDQIKSQEKYFLYLHYMDPHWPYIKRKPWYEPTKDRVQQRRSAYASEIRYVDEYIREAFEKFGWDRDTVILVTSDHGEEFFEHGGLGHGKTLYQEVIHVPLFIYASDGHLKKQRIEENVSIIDVLPTLAGLIGAQPRSHVEGRDLIQLAQGGKQSDRALYSHLTKFLKDGSKMRNYALFYGNWKLIQGNQVRSGASVNLFALDKDPGERLNLAQQTPEQAQSLVSTLESFRAECSKYPKAFVMRGEERKPA